MFFSGAARAVICRCARCAESICTAMGNLSNRVWDDILTSMRQQHPDLVRPWFHALRRVEIDNGIIRIPSSDLVQYAYLTQKCQSAIRSAAQIATGRLVTVEVTPPPPAPAHELPLAFES